MRRPTVAAVAPYILGVMLAVLVSGLASAMGALVMPQDGTHVSMPADTTGKLYIYTPKCGEPTEVPGRNIVIVPPVCPHALPRDYPKAT